MIFIRDQHSRKEGEGNWIRKRERLNLKARLTKFLTNQWRDLEQDLLFPVTHIGLQWLDIYAHTTLEMSFPQEGYDLRQGGFVLCVAEADPEVFDGWKLSTDYTSYLCAMQEVLLWRGIRVSILCLPLIFPRTQQLSQ